MINQICQSGVNCPDQLQIQNVSFRAETPQGTITGISVKGPGVASGVTLNSQGTSGTAPFVSDSWGYWPYPPILASFPPLGTGYTFTAFLTGGGTQQLVRQSPPWTTETISMSGPAGHAVANANLGDPLNINWTMPTTFTANSVNIWVNTASANGNCNADITPESLPPSTTSYAVPMPAASCQGAPVADNVSTMMPVTLSVNVRGVNGEETQVQWNFGSPISSGGGGAPGAPTNLLATASGPALINLTWNTPSGTITGYAIHRGTSPGGSYSQIGTSATPAFSDTALPAGTYYYKVVACNNASCSAFSSVASATVTGGGGGSGYFNNY